MTETPATPARTPTSFFHRTNRLASASIIASGFRDGSGNYLTLQVHEGVWLSDVPLDSMDGAEGDVLLLVIMPLVTGEADPFEWVGDWDAAAAEWGGEIGFREWLFPAKFINERACGVVDVSAFEFDDDFRGRVMELVATLVATPFV